MSLTPQNIIDSALLELGETQPGEGASTPESNNALIQLNRIYDSWSLEGIVCFNHAVSSFALAQGVGSYTMGSGGNFSIASRPIKIKGATVTYQGLQQGCAVMPMGVFEQSLDHNARPAVVEYLANGMPASAVLALWATGSMPTKLGEDSAAPLKNLRVHPIPQAAAAIELSYWLALTTFATLSTAITFPVPGYELALVEELAIVLAPSYGRPVSQELRDNAARSKGRIVEINGQIELGPPPAAPNQ